MKLKGNRIIIRSLNFNDADDYYEYGRNPNVGPNAGWKPFPNKEISNRLLSSHILSKETFAIALKDSNKLIGSISIYNQAIRKYKKVKSLGFSLNYDYWNQGYMTEAVKLVLDYLFNYTDCKIVEVGHHVDNYNSKRVIEKCGFNYDGTFNSYKVLYDGRIIDASFYSITKEEYERKKEDEERIKYEV